MVSIDIRGHLQSHRRMDQAFVSYRPHPARPLSQFRGPIPDLWTTLQVTSDLWKTRLDLAGLDALVADGGNSGQRPGWAVDALSPVGKEARATARTFTLETDML